MWMWSDCLWTYFWYSKPDFNKIFQLCFSERLDKKPLTSSWPKELKLQEIEEPNKLGKLADSDDDYESDDDDDYFEYDDEDDDYDEEDDEYDDDYYDEEIYENNEVSLAFYLTFWRQNKTGTNSASATSWVCWQTQTRQIGEG